MLKNRSYNFRHPYPLWKTTMPKRTNETLASFGERLVALRKAAGYTQTELANELGVTRRMVAYYEGETEHPPASLLTALAGALGVTIEVLLGTAPVKKAAKGGKPVNSRLARRLQQIEKLDTQEKRQVLQIIDAFIEREQLKRRAHSSQAA